MTVFRRDPLAHPEELIRRVYAYVAYRIGDGPEAEDVTSDVFERALKYRDTFDARKGQPISWLIGIARRQIAERSVEPMPMDELPEADADTEVEARSLRRIELGLALARLDARQQELIALRYGSDLTARQIGELLGLKTNAVEVALHRALARLRQLMNRDDEGLPLPSEASVTA